MSSERGDDMTGMPVSTTLSHLRHRKLEATQALLGDTIAIPEEDWHGPSRLPGWTRAHVATHLARNADGLRRVALGLLEHRPNRMYPDERARMRELELGSRRSGLELQIDLDTSAGQLNDTLNYLMEADITDPVEVRPGSWMPAHHLPVARLNEVVLHRIDLAHGFTAADVDADIAQWLLEWNCRRIGERPDFPSLWVASSTGVTARIGNPDQTPLTVHGSDASLLGWLTSRADGTGISGADSIVLPEL
ncbi:maleylpyruvate isomerase family mycothiol-dependent enzyme [Luteococcus sp. Sow4_B9]|uniref:maleylpyruvate isomerase family mycothiol-dependent enzyme n=1 Tax=Luteococcus sp. Sow4_B9 TaxID=3438792 RepID=UPI003F9AEA20